MESYSPFFQTLHDERSPTGHLGTGTHATILRVIVFSDSNGNRLSHGVPTDFAVIWDADHDTRVIQAVEAIYRGGFLTPILMIGERKGTLHTIVGESLSPFSIDRGYFKKQLDAIAQSMEGDPWSASLRTLADPGREIIDDDEDKVRLYLANLKMLWRLGARISIDDLLQKKSVPMRGPRAAQYEINQATTAVLRSSPDTPAYMDEVEFEQLWKTTETAVLEAAIRNGTPPTSPQA